MVRSIEPTPIEVERTPRCPECSQAGLRFVTVSSAPYAETICSACGFLIRSAEEERRLIDERRISFSYVVDWSS
jgi:hypothetical protein